MSIAEQFHAVLEHVQTSANVKAVYGEPLAVEGKTIIPVAIIRFGFGGGSGHNAGQHLEPSDKEGIGLGGGVGAKPLGVLEVTKETTRFIPFISGKQLVGAFVLGWLAGMFFGRK